MQGFLKRVVDRVDKLDSARVRELCLDLLTKEERLSAVIDSLPEGILISDEGNRMLLGNRALRLLIPTAEATAAAGGAGGVPVWEVIGDSDIAEFCREHLTKKSGKVQEIFTIGDSAELRAIRCTILPLVSYGKIIGNILRFEDISAEQQNQVRLHRAEQLASLTHLTANVAHEIKNPLGSIAIYIQLIQRELRSIDASAGIDTKNMLDNLDIINEEIERLNAVVIDFLFSVRPINLNMEELGVAPLIGEILELLGPEFSERGVKVTAELPEDMPHIDGDRTYLKQAVMNIIKNSIEAMPDGGELGVWACGASDTVEIHIVDSGSGIDPEIQGKVFEPYFTTKETGSGIGLTEVYKIIKEHGGEISLQGRGAGQGQRGRRGARGRGARGTPAGTECIITLPFSRRARRLLGGAG